MHVLMTKGGLSRTLDNPLARLAAYLAAMMHDYQHKGLSNDFLIGVHDELAMRYNDASPQENHHVSAALRLMNLQV